VGEQVKIAGLEGEKLDFFRFGKVFLNGIKKKHL